jgi:type IV secretory pathway TraG/TraD family ATPase VirD4
MSSRLSFGPFDLPMKAATSHFLVSGATGTGKTGLVYQLMDSVFQSPESYFFRGLIYDSKQEMLPLLSELGLQNRLVILHPYDKRCSPWDIAEDLSDALAAQQFASILIPETDSGTADSSFFDDACRNIISTAIQSLVLCSQDPHWTFRDLLVALLYPIHLEQLLTLETTTELRRFPLGRRTWDTYFNPKTTDERTRSNIRSSLNAKLFPFETVAAAWHQSGNKPFSIKKWQKENSDKILVLGNEEAARTTIDRINRAIFQQAASHTLARPEDTDSLTWFFLDEVREAGRLDSLNSLLLRGRSKGAAVILSFQDIEGLRHVYGDHLANEIVANCSNIALLRTNSSDTAEWASKTFGTFLIEEVDPSTGFSGTDITSSEVRKRQERQRVQPGELLYLPLPSASSGVAGFFKDASAGAKESPFYRLKPSAPSTRFTKYAAHEPMEKRGLFLDPWTAADLKRLGIQEEVKELPEPDQDHEPPGPPPRRPRG